MAKIAKRRGRLVLDFYDATGKRVWKTLPAGTTLTRAKELLRETEDQLDRGIYLPEKRTPSFAEVSADWIEHKRANIRQSTCHMYGVHLRLHLARLNSMKINRITIETVERFTAKRLKDGMNLTTLRKVLVTLNQVMGFAVRRRYIDHNPVRDAEKPRDRGQVEKRHVRVLSHKEVKALVESEPNPKYRTLFMLAVLSGLRQGELMGLKWTDIDWFNGQVGVERTFNNGAWYKPKSATSRRRVNLGPAMMEALKAWHKACPESALNLVFPNEAGNPLDHWHLIGRYFLPALKRAGIDRVRFHDLRHTFASLLLDQGESIKHVQTQLGHSSPTLTLNVYAHLIKPANQESARKLEASIFDGQATAINERGLEIVAKP